jgi:protein-tyrosine phosphatase
MSQTLPVRILFVCMGNICRSPAADIVLRHMVDQAGLAGRIEIDSAGTIGYHSGNPPDPRISEELASRGYPVNGSARKVTRADLADFDLVLAMDEDNLADLTRLDRSATHRAKIRPFTSFCTEHRLRDVPDPYYGGRSGFSQVADIVEDGCRGLLEALRRQLD